MNQFELLHGDCLELLKSLPDKSVDAVVTDPPYGLSNHSLQDIIKALSAWLAGEEYRHGKAGFMGKEWDSFVPSPTVWKEVYRVLKPGGHVLCAAGTRTVDLMGISLRLAGFEIRDTIEWLYGMGFPKSLDISKAIDREAGAEREVVGKHPKPAGSKGNTFSSLKQACYLTTPATEAAKEWQGFGTALKPAHEPFILARKPIENGLTIAQNCVKWGTGGLDIDGCRVETSERWNRNNQVKGFGGLKPIPLSSHQEGRFPANVIHDGSECVVEEFPETTHIEKRNYAIFRNNRRQTFTTHKEGDLTPAYPDGGGSTARFFYCAKASKSERNQNLANTGAEVRRQGLCGEHKNPFHRNFHPTVKPRALMVYLVKLISREGQVVLDPFMGSGTTGVACRQLGRLFIGMELQPDYFKIAHQRILGEAWEEYVGEEVVKESGSRKADEQLDLFRGTRNELSY